MFFDAILATMDNNLTAHPPRILVFDSGLGGLSIYQAIRQQHDYCHFIYISDNAAFPYGTKTEEQVIARVSEILKPLEQHYHPDILVIACNTASTVALPKVRSMISAPVVGVVPAIKPAGQLCQTRYAGLLATPGTVQRQYTQSLIEQFAPQFNWIKVGSSELVEMAEQKMLGNLNPTFALERMRSILAPFLNTPASELDSIVLACTHFPLLREELQQTLPHITHWIDSSEAIANRVGFWLQELRFYRENFPDKHCSNELVFTRRPDNMNCYSHMQAEMDFTSIAIF